MAVQIVENAIGSDIPDSLWDNASTLVAWKTASLVEATYYSEQIRTDRSPYEIYKTLFSEGLPALEGAVAAADAGEDLGISGGGNMPSYGFPEDEGGMVGWGTSF
jgi:hypothetical protein